jgi:DNA-binding transcriptional MerR regulator
VRALHHYDEVGLLAPSSRSPAGYRQYSQGDLERLQELLVYRRLGFGLSEIAGLLDDTAHDRRGALLRQRRLLDVRIEGLVGVRQLVERTLTTMEGAVAMSGQDMFEGLGTFERNEAEHGDEVRERWGETDAYAESARRTARYSEQDWSTITTEGEAIEAAFADLLIAGVVAEDEAAMDLAEQHRRHITRWFYPCSHETHADLGEMYVADERFRQHYDQRREGLAEYVRDAILANGRRAV